jgi:hypothetical protein
VRLHDLYFVLPADFADQITYPVASSPLNAGPPVLRYQDQMQMDLEYSVRAVSVFCHPTSLNCGAR